MITFLSELWKKFFRGKRKCESVSNPNNNPPSIEKPVIISPEFKEDFDLGTGSTRGAVAYMVSLMHEMGWHQSFNELNLFQQHRPFHESDHIMSIIISGLTGGRNAQDLDLLRQDISLTQFLTNCRFPASSTSLDFLCRFTEESCIQLMDTVNNKNAKIIKKAIRKDEFVTLAADGVFVPSDSKLATSMFYNGHKKKEVIIRW